MPFPDSCGLCVTPIPKTSYVYYKFPGEKLYCHRNRMEIEDNLAIRYVAVDGRLAVFKLTAIPRKWRVLINWVHAETGNTYRADYLSFNNFVYGDSDAPYIEIRMATGAYNPSNHNCSGNCYCNEYWVVDIKDKCGNIFTRDLLNPFTITAANSNTKIHELNGTCKLNYKPADGGAKTASKPFVTSQVLQPWSISDECGECINGWWQLAAFVDGVGVPEALVTCNQKCPNNTLVLENCKGKEVCCWDKYGKAIKSFLLN
jgi:hypothetical protein